MHVCVTCLMTLFLSPESMCAVTAKWSKPQRAAGAESAVAVDRITRLCRLCQRGVGDELHILAECEEYTPVRRSMLTCLLSLVAGRRFPP